jgi:hypothetical protein
MALDEKTLATAMETSMKEVWKEDGRGDLPETGKDDRKILFLAISRAIIKQLKDGLLEEDSHKHTITVSQVSGALQATCTDHKHRHKGS